MTKDITLRPKNIPLTASAFQHSHLLEVFVLEALGDVPVAVKHHAVWLHQLKTGGYRWACACGEQRDYQEITGPLLAEARGHFAQVWGSTPTPIWHPAAIWNDRAAGRSPPSMADLERLAKNLTIGSVSVDFEIEVVHRCGLCGRNFEIAPNDPHWVTGRGPICPTEVK